MHNRQSSLAMTMFNVEGVFLRKIGRLTLYGNHVFEFLFVILLCDPNFFCLQLQHWLKFDIFRIITSTDTFKYPMMLHIYRIQIWYVQFC